jgi:molybdenum-dependent DNA-binding transcriptional regulator ModE
MNVTKELTELMEHIEAHSARVEESLARWREWKPIIEEAMRTDGTLDGRKWQSPKHMVDEEVPEFLARVQDSWCLRWEAIHDFEDEYPTQNHFWAIVLKAAGWKVSKVLTRHIQEAKHLQHVWTNDVHNRILRYNKARELEDLRRGRSVAPPPERYEPTLSAKRPAPAGGGKTKQVWEGHGATAVIRWMGVDGWEYKQAQKVVRALDLDIADATIRAQLRGGATGKRGEPAKLTTKQEKLLYDLL